MTNLYLEVLRALGLNASHDRHGGWLVLLIFGPLGSHRGHVHSAAGVLTLHVGCLGYLDADQLPGVLP